MAHLHSPRARMRSRTDGTRESSAAASGQSRSHSQLHPHAAHPHGHSTRYASRSPAVMDASNAASASGASRKRALAAASPTRDRSARRPAAAAATAAAPTPSGALAASATGDHSRSEATAALPSAVSPSRVSSSHASDVVTYDELTSLLATNVEDHSRLASQTHRAQCLLRELRASRIDDDRSSSSHLKAVAARIWAWISVESAKMQRCQDVHAAIRILCCDLIALSCRSDLPHAPAMSAQDHVLQMRMYLVAGRIAADALSSPAECIFHPHSSRSSLLAGVDVDALLTLAHESLQRMKMRRMECAPSVEWEIYHSRALYAWSLRHYETSYDMYLQAVEQVFLKHPALMSAHTEEICRELHEKGLAMQSESSAASSPGVIGAQQSVKWLLLSARVFQADPDQARYAKKQSRCFYSLAVIYLQSHQSRAALEAAERSLHCHPQRVESMIVQTKALFLLHQFDRGRTSLLRTLDANSCADDMSIDLIEFCCDQMQFDESVAADRDRAIAIMRDAYSKMSDKYPTYEPTIVSQMRTMVKHKLNQLAIQHVDRALCLRLSLPTLASLREVIWSVAMDLFESHDYRSCMAWLQRYAKKIHLDDDDTEVRAKTALACVAIEMHDGTNALLYAEDARRLSSQSHPDGGGGGGASHHLLTALIARAAVGANNVDRARSELEHLSAHAASLSADVESMLALTAEEVTQRDDCVPIAILCMDILLHMQRRGAQTSGAAAPPFSRITILLQLIYMCQAEYDRLTLVASQIHRSRVTATATETDSAREAPDGGEEPAPSPASNTINSVEMKLADYFEQLVEAAAQPSHQPNEEEALDVSVTGWNLGRSCGAANHLEASGRIFTAAARLYDQFDANHHQRGMAAFARVHAATALLEHARTLDESRSRPLVASCLELLSRGASQLRAQLTSKQAVTHASLDPNQVVQLVPALQMKARLMMRDSEASIRHFIDSLTSTDSDGPRVHRHDLWDSMAGLALKYRQVEAACDCLRQAIQRVDERDVDLAATYWRKILTVCGDQKMISVYAELQGWLEDQSEVDGEPIYKRYNKAESQWLVNHAWSSGILYYRQRELSQCLQCFKCAQRVYHHLLAPTQGRADPQADEIRDTIGQHSGTSSNISGGQGARHDGTRDRTSD